MFGAIFGDFIGSRFEFPPIWKKEFDLFAPECEFTDDTICTVAVADILLYDQLIPKEVEKTFVAWGCKYLAKGFGQNFLQWLIDENRKPYNSLGNGCLMRASPIALLSDNLSLVHQKSDLITGISHNHPEALAWTKVYTEGLFLLFQRLQEQYLKKQHSSLKIKNQNKKFILEFFSKKGLTIKPLSFYTKSRFKVLTQPTFEITLSCLAEANSYEETIRNVMFTGSDSDTTSAIVGALAELIFGIDFPTLEPSFQYFNPYDVPLLATIIKSYQASPFKEALFYFNPSYDDFISKIKIKIASSLEKVTVEDWVLESAKNLD